MGLAISLVASEKEKVGQHGGLILHIIFLFYYCSFFGDLRSVIQKTKQTNQHWLLCKQTGVVPRLSKPRQRLLQHPAEGGRRLHHLVQWERGETRLSHKPGSALKPRSFIPLYRHIKLKTVVVSPFFNYTQLLSDIEEHLKCTITQCEPDIKIPVDEFDGKVTYGQRRALGGPLHNVENQRCCAMQVLHA